MSSLCILQSLVVCIIHSKTINFTKNFSTILQTYLTGVREKENLKTWNWLGDGQLLRKATLNLEKRTSWNHLERTSSFRSEFNWKCDELYVDGITITPASTVQGQHCQGVMSSLQLITDAEDVRLTPARNVATCADNQACAGTRGRRSSMIDVPTSPYEERRKSKKATRFFCRRRPSQCTSTTTVLTFFRVRDLGGRVRVCLGTLLLTQKLKTR